MNIINIPTTTPSNTITDDERLTIVDKFRLDFSNHTGFIDALLKSVPSPFQFSGLNITIDTPVSESFTLYFYIMEYSGANNAISNKKLLTSVQFTKNSYFVSNSFNYNKFYFEGSTNDIHIETDSSVNLSQGIITLTMSCILGDVSFSNNGLNISSLIDASIPLNDSDRILLIQSNILKVLSKSTIDSMIDDEILSKIAQAVLRIDDIDEQLSSFRIEVDSIIASAELTKLSLQSQIQSLFGNVGVLTTNVNTASTNAQSAITGVSDLTIRVAALESAINSANSNSNQAITIANNSFVNSQSALSTLAVMNESLNTQMDIVRDIATGSNVASAQALSVANNALNSIINATPRRFSFTNSTVWTVTHNENSLIHIDMATGLDGEPIFPIRIETTPSSFSYYFYELESGYIDTVIKVG